MVPTTAAPESIPSAPTELLRFVHEPVMVTEVLEALLPERGGPYWDLTLGAGGHLGRFLDVAPPGTLAIGVDGDPDALIRAAHHLRVAGHAVTVDGPVRLVHDDIGALGASTTVGALLAAGLRPRAVLGDFGLSSPQIEDASRGFSYRHSGPLDMRMDPSRGEPASTFLEHIGQKALERLIGELGEERYAGRIARTIKESLPILTTDALCAVVENAVGGHRDGKHHPARRTFQALRIAVNDELGRIERALAWAIASAAPGARIATITFHSGEDRVVKDVFRDAVRDGRASHVVLASRPQKAGKPIDCSDDEAERNPRARSAKLRVIEVADPDLTPSDPKGYRRGPRASRA
ncbi:MAG: 16S rRNA (cytosine(1402)-N(4))-methyltransferase RsmH [Myxococcales bacterium]|nr:16S rRNA (cytosine(1402)-N(4))-methyltransferase RsmH [Myxococcales bacterium]